MVKIAPKVAESFIAKPDAQCILLYGPDAGLARERVHKLKDHFLGKDFDPFAFVEFEESALLSDPAKLSDEILAISMMAPRRFILIRDGGDKLTAILKDASPHLNRDVQLVVIGGELSTRSSLRKWFEDDSRAAALACYHDEVRDVLDVIRKHFAAAGIQPDRDVPEYLSQQLGNDRYVTHQELEKIITFASISKKLTLADAKLLVNFNKDSNLDDIVQAAADQDLQNLDKHVQQQLREGVQPVAYLRALQRYFSRLYAIKAQVVSGQNLDEVIRNLKPKVFYKQEQSLRRHVQNWNVARLAKAYAILANAELACKTSDLPAAPASSRRLMQLTQIR